MRIKVNANPFEIASNHKNNGYSINRRTNSKWFEVDLFANKKNFSGGNTANFLVDQKIINIWFIVLMLGIVLLATRTAYLQLFEGSYFRSVAEGNRVRIRDIKATRGIIYDRNNKLLVENIPSFSLAIIPVDLPKKAEERRQIAQDLAKISQKSADEIYNIIAGQSLYSYQPVVIQENLNQDQAILAKISTAHFPGVVLQVDNTRHYLESANTLSLSHILGYEGKIEENKLQDYLSRGYLIDDYVGKTGLETFYEPELKGVNGREQVEVDATGEAKEILAYQKPISGNNLILNIDADLQNKAESSLKTVLQANGKKKGTVIILDPSNGGVLALVSWPAFDNNLFSQGISQNDLSELANNPSQPLFPRAISGEYPPGSTFKLVVGAAALQEKIIDQNTSFLSSGGIYVNQWFFPDWKAGGHGWTNITKGIAESVNTFFYTIGGGYKDFKGLGIEKIKKYAEMFGLDKKLGIDLPGEATGFVPSEEWKERVKKEQWYIGDTYHAAIGQGDLLATPLQLANWTSVFANGGTLYQPQVLKAVLDNNNQIVKTNQPQVLNKDFIDSKNIKIISQGMRQAVLAGSARRLGDLPISVAAKTGTAQWASNQLSQAWLTCYAPFENPKIVVTVLLEESGEGSSMALPVAYDILDWWIQNRLNPTTTPQTN
ncbi:MAG: penicillin-binding protein 2 [Patescibacteria group bacterium]